MKEVDEINPEDLEAAAELYDAIIRNPEEFYRGKKLMPEAQNN